MIDESLNDGEKVLLLVARQIAFSLPTALKLILYKLLSSGSVHGCNYPFLLKKNGIMRRDSTSLRRGTYASTQGRFTSVDPLLASAKRRNPQTWNRYTYG